MKKIISALLFSIISVFSFSSCMGALDLLYVGLLLITGGEDFDDDIPQRYYYYYVEFRDDQDKHNLLTGIPLDLSNYNESVMHKEYQLDVILADKSAKWNQDFYSTHATNDRVKPSIEYRTENINGEPYLIFYFKVDDETCLKQPKLTYRFKCPHIFGDDSFHEYAIYWNHNNSYYPSCTKLETDDPRITDWDLCKNGNTLTLYIKSNSN